MSAEEKKGKKSPPPRISSYAVKVEEKTAEFEKKLELLQESQNEKSKLKNSSFSCEDEFFKSIINLPELEYILFFSFLIGKSKKPIFINYFKYF